MMNINVQQSFKEFAQDEVKDFVLSLVEAERNRYPDEFQCRRKELCDAILACNKKSGKTMAIRDEVVSTLKSTPINKVNLEKVGLRVIPGSKHYKLEMCQRPYRVIASKSASDKRAQENLAAMVVRVFF